MPRPSGPRPNLRKYPDPIDNKLFVDCMRARAQAWYLGEEWYISDDDYVRMWRENDNYLKKGRHNEDLCLTRIDYNMPWQLDNVRIISRAEHYQYCSKNKIGKFKLRSEKRKEKALAQH